MLEFGDGVAKELRFPKLISPMHTLALFRCGREEAANELLALAITKAYRQLGWPFSLMGLLPLVQVLWEMLCRAKMLRKKNKMARLQKSFQQAVNAIRQHAKSVPTSTPHAQYWHGIAYRSQGQNARAIASFEECVVFSSKPEMCTHPGALAQLALEQLASGGIVRKDTLEQIAEAADLRTLYELANEGGIDRAQQHYNNMLLDRELEEIWKSGDGAVDDTSSTRSLGVFAKKHPVERKMSALSIGGNFSADSMSGSTMVLQTQRSFVGRHMEIAEFERTLALSGNDDDGSKESGLTEKAWAIFGVPGIGKTALLEEFESRCPDDVLVLRGSARQSERQTAYYSFRNVFAKLFELPSTGTLNEKTKAVEMVISESSLFQVIPHIPLLNVVLPIHLVDTNATKSMTGRMKEEATVNCLARFVAAASFTRRLVLLLDDAQWMDTNSLSLVKSMRKLNNVMVIIASRSGSVIDSQQLDDFFARCTGFTLKAMSEEEAEELLLVSFELKTIDKDVLTFCHARAGGIPFVLTRMLQTLLDAELCVITLEGVATLNEAKVKNAAQFNTLETPSTVRELIRERLSKLDPASLNILWV